MTARILRAITVAIAIAAAVDPPLTIGARGRPRVAVVVGSPGDERAQAVRSRILDRGRSFDLVQGADSTADAAIVIGDVYPHQRLPSQQRTFTVSVTPANAEPSVRVSHVRVPRQVPAATLIHVDVDVDSANIVGAASSLTVRTGDAGVEVGRATHTWTASPERWRASLDVTPLDAPPWRLHVVVSSAPGERALADNAADALVELAEPLRVFVYEPRLSWAGTFVRRALEQDVRFDVASVAAPSRGVSVASGGLPTLRDAVASAQAIVVGGLDRLSSDETAMLTTFMRERGGALVLLPDSREDARSAARSLPIPQLSETLLERPSRLSVDAPLRAIDASELLTFAAAPGLRTLARNGDAPVIVTLPVGAGRMTMSGALDAWRFRANNEHAYDAFWRSTIAGLAAATPPAIDVAIEPAVLAPGAPAGVRVHVRRGATRAGSSGELRVSAAIGGGSLVRLWPDTERDTLRGSFDAPSALGRGRLTVASAGAQGSASFLVASQARDARPADPPLALLAASRGGIDATPDDTDPLLEQVRQSANVRSVRMERRPMRSLWWFLLFAACLGGEWSLRRRHGRR